MVLFDMKLDHGSIEVVNCRVRYREGALISKLNSKEMMTKPILSFGDEKNKQPGRKKKKKKKKKKGKKKEKGHSNFWK